jgi:hypothetical protein
MGLYIIYKRLTAHYAKKKEINIDESRNYEK